MMRARLVVEFTLVRCRSRQINRRNQAIAKINGIEKLYLSSTRRTPAAYEGSDCRQAHCRRQATKERLHQMAREGSASISKLSHNTHPKGARVAKYRNPEDHSRLGRAEVEAELAY